MEQYQYNIKYKPGKDILHADALSRKPPVSAVQLPHEFDADESVDAQKKYTVLQKVRDYWRLRQKPPPLSSRQVKEYFKRRGAEILEENGILLVASNVQRQRIRQLLVSTSMVPRILKKGHDEAGKSGVEKTLKMVRRRFFWAKCTEMSMRGVNLTMLANI